MDFLSTSKRSNEVPKFSELKLEVTRLQEDQDSGKQDYLQHSSGEKSPKFGHGSEGIKDSKIETPRPQDGNHLSDSHLGKPVQDVAVPIPVKTKAETSGFINGVDYDIKLK